MIIHKWTNIYLIDIFTIVFDNKKYIYKNTIYFYPSLTIIRDK